MSTIISTETPSAFTTSTYSYASNESSIPDAIAYSNSNPYNTSPDSPDGWAYPPGSHSVQNQPLRNAQRTGVPAPTSAEQWNTQATYRTDTDTTTFRTWPGAEPSYQTPIHSHANVYNTNDVDPSNRPYHPSAQPDGREYHQWNHSQQDSYTPNYDTPALYGAPAYPQQSPQTPYYQSNYPQSNTSSSSSPHTASHPLPRHVYTRTLVGPLSCNACRLLDEHQIPGIFFLFQDLSVRTEGSKNFITSLFFSLTLCSKYASRDLSTTLTADECWRVRMFTPSGVSRGCGVDCLILILALRRPRPARCAFTHTHLPSLRRLSRSLSSFSLPSDSQEYQVCQPESIGHLGSHFYTCQKQLRSRLHLVTKAKSFHW